MRTHNEESTIFASFIRPILIGVLVGALGFVLCLFVLAALGSGMNIPPALVIPLAIVAVAAAAFIGGFVSGKIARRNGWLVGSLSAFILFGISTLAGYSLFANASSGFLCTKAMIMLACGLVGGVIAVNLKTKRKKR